MRLESREQIESLEGDERERALITLHHADDNTLDRLDVTRAEVDQWIADAGITPPPLTIVGAPTLEEAKSQALVQVRREVHTHITIAWPEWRQINCEAGIYPAAEKDQKDADIAATIEESNRVEDAIDAAATVADVDAAVASLSLPTFPVTP